MYSCWAWLNGEWVEGIDVGTRRGYTIFRPLDSAYEPEYSVGHYCKEWQISYGKQKPTHKDGDVELIQQTLRSM